MVHLETEFTDAISAEHLGFQSYVEYIHYGHISKRVHSFSSNAIYLHLSLRWDFYHEQQRFWMFPPWLHQLARPRAPELCQHRSRCFGDDYKALSTSSFQRNRNIRNIARKNKSPLYSALLTRLRRMPGGVGSERLLSPRGLIAWRGIELREVLGPTGGFRACRRF